MYTVEMVSCSYAWVECFTWLPLVRKSHTHQKRPTCALIHQKHHPNGKCCQTYSMQNWQVLFCCISGDRQPPLLFNDWLQRVICSSNRCNIDFCCLQVQIYANFTAFSINSEQDLKKYYVLESCTVQEISFTCTHLFLLHCAPLFAFLRSPYLLTP